MFDIYVYIDTVQDKGTHVFLKYQRTFQSRKGYYKMC